MLISNSFKFWNSISRKLSSIFINLLLIKDKVSKVFKNLTFLNIFKLSIKLLSKYNFFNFVNGTSDRAFISLILFLLKFNSSKLKNFAFINSDISVKILSLKSSFN